MTSKRAPKPLAQIGWEAFLKGLESGDWMLAEAGMGLMARAAVGMK